MASAAEAPMRSHPGTIYNPLADFNEIRLLHLQPGCSEDPILCRLEQVNFTDKPKYEALSYMWGSKDSPLHIEVNGTMVEVRNNLWQALYHLRGTDAARILWIDALCINQDDVNERNHQVSQMGRIYESCVCVVAWLGLHDDSSRAAMEFIQNFKGAEFPAMDSRKVDDRIVDLIIALCEREYWTRLWIVQELVVAPKVVLQCGNLSVSWGNFSGILEGFSQIAADVIVPFQDTTEIDEATHQRCYQLSRLVLCIPRKLDYEREKVHNLTDRRPLIDLCIDYGEGKCEDSRDKVFGLRAFTQECCQKAVAVDYSLSLHEISRRLLSHRHTTFGISQKARNEQALRVFLSVSWEDLYKAGFSQTWEGSAL